MSYIVYHRVTTRFLKNHPGVKSDQYLFATMGSAKAALTRAVKNTALKVQPILAEDFAIAPADEFYSKIEKTETVKSLLSGQDVVQSVNTPWCCNPASETYHSM